LRAMHFKSVVCYCISVVLLNFSGSRAHGNFHFIGPNVQSLCKSIMENVMTKYSVKTIKHYRKGDHYVSHLHTAHSVSTVIKCIYCIHTVDPLLYGKSGTYCFPIYLSQKWS